MAFHTQTWRFVAMVYLMFLSSSVCFTPPQPVHYAQHSFRKAHVSVRPQMRMSARPEEIKQAVQCAENEYTLRGFQPGAKKPVIIAEADNVTAAVVPFRQGSTPQETPVTAAVVPSQLGSVSAARKDVEGIALEPEVQADQTQTVQNSRKDYSLLGLSAPKRSTPEAKQRKSYSLGLDPEAKAKKDPLALDATAPTTSENVNIDVASPAQVFHGVYEQVYGVYTKRNGEPTVDVLGTIQPALNEVSSQTFGMDLNRAVEARDKSKNQDKRRKSYSLGLDPAAKAKTSGSFGLYAPAPTTNNNVDGASSAQVTHGVYKSKTPKDEPKVNVLGAIKPTSDEVSSQTFGMDLNRAVEARDKSKTRDKRRKSYSLGLDPAAKAKTSGSFGLYAPAPVVEEPEAVEVEEQTPPPPPVEAFDAKKEKELEEKTKIEAAMAKELEIAVKAKEERAQEEKAMIEAAKAKELEEKAKIEAAKAKELEEKAKEEKAKIEAAKAKEEEIARKEKELEEKAKIEAAKAKELEEKAKEEKAKIEAAKAKEEEIARKEKELAEKAKIAAAKVQEVAKKVAEREAKLLQMRAEQQKKDLARAAEVAAKGKNEPAAHAGVVQRVEEEEEEAQVAEKNWYDVAEDKVVLRGGEAKEEEEAVAVARREEAPALGQTAMMSLLAGVACVSGAWGALVAGLGTVQEVGAGLFVALTGLAIGAFVKREQDAE